MIAGAQAQNFERETARAGTVIVEAFSDDRDETADVAHLGVVVGDGKVLTIDAAVNRAERIVIIRPDGVGVSATLDAIDAENGLALLAIAALEGVEAPMLVKSVVENVEIHSARFDVSSAAVTFSRGAVSNAENAGAMLEHLVLSGPNDFGGPVFDDCGALIGVTLPESGTTRRDLRRGRGAPKDKAIAAGADAIADFLSTAGVTLDVREETCAPQAAKDAEQAAEKERLAKEARDATARADKLEAEAKAIAADRDEEKKAAEEAAAQARREAEAAKAAQAAADDAESELEEIEEELAAATSDIEETEEEKEELKKGLIASLAGGGVVLAIVIFAAGFLLRKRNARLAEARNDATLASEEAERLRAEPKAVPPFNDCLLENLSGSNVKLPGALLPLAAGGVVVGRHPAHANAIIDDERVSRRHARFYEEDGQLYVEDLGSSNQTKVNGHALIENTPQSLSDGATIKIARHEFRLRIVS